MADSVRPNQGSFRRPVVLGLCVAGVVSWMPPLLHGAEPKPPFEMGRIHIIDPADPNSSKPQPPRKIEILEPKANATLRSAGSLDCLFRLTIAPDGTLPEFLVVSLKKGNVIFGQSSAEPKQKVSDRVYLFEARPGNTVYKAVGDFTLEVEAVDVYTKKFRPYSSLVEDKVIRTYKRIPLHFQGESKPAKSERNGR